MSFALFELPDYPREAFYPQAGVIACCWIWFQLYPPVPAVAIGFLGVVAAIMAVRADRFGPKEKAVWIAISFALFMVEMHSIYKDRDDSQQQQEKARRDERESFSALLAQEQRGVQDIIKTNNRSIAEVLRQDQEHFERTLRESANARIEETHSFAALLTKEQELFNNQEQLFSSLNGKLIPANEPTPDNACKGDSIGDSFLVILGKDLAVPVSKFPHYIISIRTENVLWIDREPNGDITLNVDERANDGKLLLRIDRAGFVVPPGIHLIPRRPDKSTVVIEDPYGTEIFRAHYANSKAFQLTGSITAFGRGILFDHPILIGCSTFPTAMADIALD